MNLCVAICLLALTASAKADGLGQGLGGLVYAPQHASVDYYAYPRYAFEYSVRDPHTGDNKAQWEKRDGDVVKGAYSLVEPDGSLRVVEYHADDKTGFNAVVKRLGPNLHPATVHAPIYKAPIPLLSGHDSVLSPISVGPVANLGHLASAPLITGPIYGGPIHSPALSTQNLLKEPVIVKSLPAPIQHEPVLHEPILHQPIVNVPHLQEPIFREPIIKGPILPRPIYKTSGPIVTEPYVLEPNFKGPILSGPRYNEPILRGLPGPIYKAGPIYSEPLGPLPDYRAPLSHYNQHVPIQREPLPALPLLKEPVGLGVLGKGGLGSLNWEGGRGQLGGYGGYGYGLGKGIGPSLEGHVPLRANIGPPQLGLIGKELISSVDWEGSRGPFAGGYKGEGPLGPSYNGYGLLKGNIGPILPYAGLEKTPLPSWNGPIEYPLYPSGYKH